jgi:hypothetical protein
MKASIHGKKAQQATRNPKADRRVSATTRHLLRDTLEKQKTGTKRTRLQHRIPAMHEVRPEQPDIHGPEERQERETCIKQYEEIHVSNDVKPAAENTENLFRLQVFRASSRGSNSPSTVSAFISKPAPRQYPRSAFSNAMLYVRQSFQRHLLQASANNVPGANRRANNCYVVPVTRAPQ